MVLYTVKLRKARVEQIVFTDCIFVVHWTGEAASMPAKVSAGCSVTVGNKVYLIGMLIL